jgi:hypothetical protein
MSQTFLIVTAQVGVDSAHLFFFFLDASVLHKCPVAIAPVTLFSGLCFDSPPNLLRDHFQKIKIVGGGGWIRLPTHTQCVYNLRLTVHARTRPPLNMRRACEMSSPAFELGEIIFLVFLGGFSIQIKPHYNNDRGVCVCVCGVWGGMFRVECPDWPVSNNQV